MLDLPTACLQFQPHPCVLAGSDGAPREAGRVRGRVQGELREPAAPPAAAGRRRIGDRAVGVQRRGRGVRPADAVALSDGPAWAVYTLAGLAAILATAFLPAESALLPELARNPEELTAANVTRNTIDSVGSFLAPGDRRVAARRDQRRLGLPGHGRDVRLGRGDRRAGPTSARRSRAAGGRGEARRRPPPGPVRGDLGRGAHGLARPRRLLRRDCAPAERAADGKREGPGRRHCAGARAARVPGGRRGSPAERQGGRRRGGCAVGCGPHGMIEL
jgi:hypothetical protein